MAPLAQMVIHSAKGDEPNTAIGAIVTNGLPMYHHWVHWMHHHWRPWITIVAICVIGDRYWIAIRQLIEIYKIPERLNYYATPEMNYDGIRLYENDE
jgi:hypothetical protein